MSRVFEPSVTKVSHFSNVVYALTPSFQAIGPYVRLFDRVKYEYTTDSKIAQNGSFKKYMLGKHYAFVHMARECVNNRTLLRDCKIIPLRSADEYGGHGQPFWFKIEHTRFDKAKNTEKEICDNFWKSFGGFGVKLVHLGMTFDDIRNNINRIIQNEMTHAVKVRVTTADVVLSCRGMLGVKRSGWYGRKNWEDIVGKVYNRSNNNSVYSRPKVTDEQFKKYVLKKYKRRVVETVWYETKPTKSSKSSGASSVTSENTRKSNTGNTRNKQLNHGGKYNDTPIVKKKFTVSDYIVSSNKSKF